MVPTPVSVSKTMISEATLELWPSILEAVGPDQEMEPLVPAPKAEVTNEEAELPTPISGSIPIEVHVLVQDSIEPPTVKPEVLASEESVVPTIQESLQQERVPPEIGATLRNTKPDVPIVEESLPHESMVPKLKRLFLVPVLKLQLLRRWRRP